MTQEAAKFTGSIPTYYDEELGPVIFIQYAEDIAARAKSLNPSNVLEMAAGTGIVSRALRDALPKSTDILSTDLNEAMLDVARTKFKDGERIDFRSMDAMSIPHADDTYDMILSQFGVMFFPDKVASYREALRVLKPGGTYLLNVWGSWDECPWAPTVHNAVAAFFRGDPPGFYKVPFHYSDTKQLQRDFAAAGFTDIEIEKVKSNGPVASHEAFATGAIMGNPVSEEIKAQPGNVETETVRNEVAKALEKKFGAAPTTMPLVAYVITAKKPSPKKGLFARVFGS